MKKDMTKEEALVELGKGYGKAEEILANEEQVDNLMKELDNKLEALKKVGEKLSRIPLLVDMAKSYFKKEYKEIPKGVLIAIISALFYFVLPTDVIPDFLPGLGYVDDVAVVATCVNLIDYDIKKYIAWREAKNANEEDAKEVVHERD